MDPDNRSPELTRLAAVIEPLGLRELGYRIDYQQQPSGYVGVRLGHPLLLEKTHGFHADSTRPEWAEWIRDQVVSWPDVALVREAVLRPESVPIVAALRHGAFMAGLGKSEDTSQSVVQATSLAGLALAAAGVLTPEEAEWLLGALESDQQWAR